MPTVETDSQKAIIEECHSPINQENVKFNICGKKKQKSRIFTIFGITIHRRHLFLISNFINGFISAKHKPDLCKNASKFQAENKRCCHITPFPCALRCQVSFRLIYSNKSQCRHCFDVSQYASFL